MLTAHQLLAALTAMEITYVAESHRPIFTMADSKELPLVIQGVRCKNLFLRDRRGAYYLVVTTPSKSVSLSELGKGLNTQRLSLASPDDLLSILGVYSGALSPLALFNDTEQSVALVIDEELKLTTNYVLHPLDNAMSVQLTRAGLETFLLRTGHIIRWTYIPERVTAIQKDN